MILLILDIKLTKFKLILKYIFKLTYQILQYINNETLQNPWRYSIGSFWISQKSY